MQIPTQIPARLYAGDTLRARLTFDGYSPDTHLLNVSLVGPDSTDMSVTGDGTAFLVTIAPEDSAEIPPGAYRWYARAVDLETLDTTTVDEGRIEVLANPADLDPPVEQRSFARQALEQIEAALLAKSSTLSFSLFGRSYQYESREDMLKAREYYRREVAREEDQQRIERGEPSRRTAFVRFGRVV